MDTEELRRACVRAGLTIVEIDGHWYVRLAFADLSPEIKEHREWIESRCADLLVGMVRERETTMCKQLRGTFTYADDAIECYSMEEAIAQATTEQRITAAMEVLGDGQG